VGNIYHTRLVDEKLPRNLELPQLFATRFQSNLAREFYFRVQVPGLYMTQFNLNIPPPPCLPASRVERPSEAAARKNSAPDSSDTKSSDSPPASTVLLARWLSYSHIVTFMALTEHLAKYSLLVFSHLNFVSSTDGFQGSSRHTMTLNRDWTHA